MLYAVLTKDVETTIAEQLVASDFMSSPSQETLKNIISRFIDATGNEALKTAPCGSCANKHHLIPNTAHPAHKLVDELLIYTPALGPSGRTVRLCNGCRNHLLSSKISLYPSDSCWPNISLLHISSSFFLNKRNHSLGIAARCTVV